MQPCALDRRERSLAGRRDLRKASREHCGEPRSEGQRFGPPGSVSGRSPDVALMFHDLEDPGWFLSFTVSLFSPFEECRFSHS